VTSLWSLCVFLGAQRTVSIIILEPTARGSFKFVFLDLAHLLHPYSAHFRYFASPARVPALRIVPTITSERIETHSNQFRTLRPHFNPLRSILFFYFVLFRYFADSARVPAPRAVPVDVCTTILIYFVSFELVSSTSDLFTLELNPYFVHTRISCTPHASTRFVSHPKTFVTPLLINFEPFDSISNCSEALKISYFAYFAHIHYFAHSARVHAPRVAPVDVHKPTGTFCVQFPRHCIHF